MIDERFRLEEQIQRCRRLAGIMTDDEARHALEALAEEYESRLPKRQHSFMLGRASRD